MQLIYSTMLPCMQMLVVVATAGRQLRSACHMQSR